MKRFAVGSLFAALGFSVGAWASPQYVYVGQAGSRCASVFKEWPTMSSYGKDMYTFWAAGFLDGGATALEVPRTKDSAATTISRFLGYCGDARHAENTITDAGISILREMLNQK